MKRRSFVLTTIAGGLTLTACDPNEKSVVDKIIIHKGQRRMELYRNGSVYKSYRIHLGFEPVGHKQFEGDGKTPEGNYYIWKKNPRSSFHLSLWISYPNSQDRAYASARGRSPGGEIFIHGGPNRAQDRNKRDWTAGCIAVTDKEIEEIYRLVGIGTPIEIRK